MLKKLTWCVGFGNEAKEKKVRIRSISKNLQTPGKNKRGGCFGYKWNYSFLDSSKTSFIIV